MPNYGYHLARVEGAAMRRVYAVLIPAIVRRPVPVEGMLPFEVFSYSGEHAIPEQIASIRSLLRYAGRPKSFTIVSDGSHSQRSRELLEQMDSSVCIAEAAEYQPPYVPPEAVSYLANHPTGRQLALIMSLPIKNEPALYIDSDVLFFPGARALSSLSTTAPALYLADCRLSADERLYRDDDEKKNPVNTGVLFLAQRIDWSVSFERLLALDGSPNFFTNQTLTHLAMTRAGAAPFDPARFVLQLDDQFEWRDRHAARNLVLRHYVNPVRHKFWTALARQPFLP
jgi:hypothetical protein